MVNVENRLLPSAVPHLVVLIYEASRLITLSLKTEFSWTQRNVQPLLILYTSRLFGLCPASRPWIACSGDKAHIFVYSRRRRQLYSQLTTTVLYWSYIFLSCPALFVLLRLELVTSYPSPCNQAILPSTSIIRGSLIVGFIKTKLLDDGDAVLRNGTVDTWTV